MSAYSKKINRTLGGRRGDEGEEERRGDEKSAEERSAEEMSGKEKSGE